MSNLVCVGPRVSFEMLEDCAIRAGVDPRATGEGRERAKVRA
jgi:hypothetical protein